MVSPLKKVISYKLWVISLSIFLFLTSHFSFLTSHTYAQSSEYVRVAIIQDTTSTRLKINGSYEVIDTSTSLEYHGERSRTIDLQSSAVLYRGKNINTAVTVDKEGISLGNIKSKTNKLFIKSDDPKGILIDERRFRGNIQFIKKDNLRLTVINHIDLEDYIKGILYHEASHYWPDEALLAQAIVCRSYALYQIEVNKFKDFDVTSDIYSQVYGGSISERYRTNKIVNQTKGVTLTYQGKLIPAYYHATCGGHTENASLLWNIDIVPLKGVACDFCQDSPHFKWYKVLSLNDIKDKLINSGYKIREIKDIVILSRDKSGRLLELNLIDSQKAIKILAKDFRNIIDPNIIRSTNFNINIVSQDAVFEGYGWGHGVGLCQWGAYFMAKQGYKYDAILKYYYPEATISSLTLNP